MQIKFTQREEIGKALVFSFSNFFLMQHLPNASSLLCCYDVMKTIKIFSGTWNVLKMLGLLRAIYCKKKNNCVEKNLYFAIGYIKKICFNWLNWLILEAGWNVISAEETVINVKKGMHWCLNELNGWFHRDIFLITFNLYF